MSLTQEMLSCYPLVIDPFVRVCQVMTSLKWPAISSMIVPG